MKFRVAHLLWLQSLLLTAATAYGMSYGLAFTAIIAIYWWSVIRWFEGEYRVLQAVVVLALFAKVFEPFAPQEPANYQKVALALFLLVSVMPVWRKETPWYDQMG